MKTITNLRNNVKKLKAKIEKKYFESSLYVIIPINNANNILMDT
jgi:hypothetical protein